MADPRVGGETGAEGFAPGDDRQYVLGEGAGQDRPQQPCGEGVQGEGLRTTVLPAASAGANFAEASWRGKFHGTMAATGPSGRQRISLRTGRPSVMGCEPGSSSAK